MHFTTLAVATLSAVASATTIRVDVGKDGLTFQPADIKADVGDVLEFHYYPRNHSVVAADFATPCQPKAQGGFFSGYVPVSAGESTQVFQVTVADTKPIWFYCSQATHCKAGMVGSVNANANKTLAAFKDAASKVTSISAPASVFGGTLKSSGSAPSTSGVASPSTSATRTGGPSATTTPKSGAASIGSMTGLLAAAVVMAVGIAA